jgi:Protein of unknown function (DUF3485)
MLRVVFPLLAAILLIGDGVFCGLRSNRWQTSQDIPAAAASIDRVPDGIGDWKATVHSHLSDQVVAQAGFAGYLQRRYENKAGSTMDVLLACGQFGPLSVHTPDVCYAGLGYAPQDKPVNYTEPAGSPVEGAEFFKAQFGKANNVTPGRLEIYWTWNAGAGWVAPRNPRWTFAGAPVLYKLYVVHEILDDSNRTAEEETRKFIRDLLPELNKRLAFGPEPLERKP